MAVLRLFPVGVVTDALLLSSCLVEDKWRRSIGCRQRLAHRNRPDGAEWKRRGNPTSHRRPSFPVFSPFRNELILDAQVTQQFVQFVGHSVRGHTQTKASTYKPCTQSRSITSASEISSLRKNCVVKQDSNFHNWCRPEAHRNRSSKLILLCCIVRRGVLLTLGRSPVTTFGGQDWLAPEPNDRGWRRQPRDVPQDLAVVSPS